MEKSHFRYGESAGLIRIPLPLEETSNGVEHTDRQQKSPCYRVGPIELRHGNYSRVVYLVRGEKGSVTYHDNGEGEHADINIHSLTREPNNQKCMWNGDVPTHCDGRLCGRIADVEEIWLTLESDYQRL